MTKLYRLRTRMGHWTLCYTIMDELVRSVEVKTGDNLQFPLEINTQTLNGEERIPPAEEVPLDLSPLSIHHSCLSEQAPSTH